MILGSSIAGAALGAVLGLATYCIFPSKKLWKLLLSLVLNAVVGLMVGILYDTIPYSLFVLPIPFVLDVLIHGLLVGLTQKGKFWGLLSGFLSGAILTCGAVVGVLCYLESNSDGIGIVGAVFAGIAIVLLALAFYLTEKENNPGKETVIVD